MSSLYTMSFWSAPVIMTTLAIFNLLVCAVERAYPALFPEAHRRLVNTSAHYKHRYFFCYIVTYAALAFIQIPACYIALRSPAPSLLDNHGSRFNAAGEICIGSRAFLFAFELPYLGNMDGLWLHHFVSLVSMILMVTNGAPARQMYVMYLSMANEFIGKLADAMILHGIDKTNPQLIHKLRLGKVISMWTLRLGVVSWAFLDTCISSDIPSPLPLGAGWLYFGAYTACRNWKLGSRLGLYGITTTKTMYLRVGSMRCSLFEIVFKTSLVLFMFSASHLYNHGDTQLQQNQPGPIPWLGSALATCIGLSSAAWASGSLHTKYLQTACARHYYWFEGGLSISTILVGVVVNFGHQSLDATSLLAALATSILVLEAGIHIGCCFEEQDCCDRDHQVANHEAHVLTSLAAMSAFGTILVLLARQTITLSEAGALAMLTRGVIRMSLYTFEYRQSAYLIIMHTMIASLTLACLYKKDTGVSVVYRPIVYLVPGLSSAGSVVAVKALQSCKACRMLLIWLSTPLNFSLLGAAAITLAALFLAPSEENSKINEFALKSNGTRFYHEKVTDGLDVGEAKGHMFSRAGSLAFFAAVFVLPVPFVNHAAGDIEEQTKPSAIAE